MCDSVACEGHASLSGVSPRASLHTRCHSGSWRSAVVSLRSIPHGPLHNDRTQRIAGIDQVNFQRVNDAAAVESFTQQQGAGIAGRSVAVQLDVDGLIAGG